MAVVQAEHGLPAHQLISESPTRFDSRQQTVERILQQEKVTVQVLWSDKKTRHLAPTWQDIDVSIMPANNATNMASLVEQHTYHMTRRTD